jgi:putative endonuclease
MKEYYVYILTSHDNKILYTGITSNIRARIQSHRDGVGSLFTSKYNVSKLVYLETFSSSLEAIYREKQIKAGSRLKKVQLISKCNPEWKNLL